MAGINHEKYLVRKPVYHKGARTIKVARLPR